MIAFIKVSSHDCEIWTDCLQIVLDFLRSKRIIDVYAAFQTRKYEALFDLGLQDQCLCMHMSDNLLTLSFIQIACSNRFLAFLER